MQGEADGLRRPTCALCWEALMEAGRPVLPQAAFLSPGRLTSCGRPVPAVALHYRGR
jgi:hypothetical protein